jgi:hypothetical protein
MQYMLMNYVPSEGSATPENAKDATNEPAWAAYTKALIDAGVMKGGNALHEASAATTLRMRNGKREVQDGPYADSKEQLGGYYIIDVPNLDVALEWAAKSPAAATGCIEVRPILSQ